MLPRLVFFAFVLTFRTFYVHNMFSPCSAKRRASDKELPVGTSNEFNLICFDLISTGFKIFITEDKVFVSRNLFCSDEERRFTGHFFQISLAQSLVF